MSEQQPRSPERAEVEYVTKNFSALQGLRILPAAVLFAVWAASEAQLLAGPVWWTLFGASLVGAAVATPLIGRWYAERFGSVEPRRRTSPSARMALAILGVGALALVVVVSGAFGWLPEVERIAVSGAVLGAALVVVAGAQGPVGRRVHPWTHRFGAVLAVVSLLPVGMVTGGGAHPLNASGAMPMVIATFFVVAACDSHRALVSLLPGRHAA